MSQKKNSFSRLPSLEPQPMTDFMKGIFMSVEESALTRDKVLKSFADVGLSPWNPELIRELCRVHCPPPSILNTTPQLRKLERIMRDISAEQEAEQERLIELGKQMTPDSSRKEPLYYLRNGKVVRSQDSEGLSKCPASKRSINSTEMQPPEKRPRRTQSSRKPR